jgi:hypothetical protein
MLRNILNALMEVSVKGNDAITLSNCMQALQQVIIEAEAAKTPTQNNDSELVSEDAE